ncbi:TetR/AcrR family transcriptional regulator [Pseudarthrobacter equi]|uniref:TetR/AcrR family transcriptional regulator n=1 Tax=Pseudarthrobacter equi TaxID=728066 RepID=UPI0028D89784|nr:TetR/AcrR family transcriptional regulator [Pseudarthrobacter equi]
MTKSQTAPRRRTPRGQGKARLVAIAGDLFVERGIGGTSLQSIADRLGVTKAAVYHQFATKDDIVLAVAAPVIERLRAIADTAEPLEGEEARIATIGGLVDLALQERSTAALMRRDPAMARLLEAHDPYLEQITRIDALLLGPNPTDELRIALAFAGAGINSAGDLPGLDQPAATIRAGLVAAMTRALTP